MKKLFLIILIIPILFACSTIQPQIVLFDDQNAAFTVANAKQIMKHWQMNSAAIREGLGAAIQEKLPASFGKALNDLDVLSQKYGANQEGMLEADAGRIVVLVGKLITPLVQSILDQYAPDVWGLVLKYLPVFITL